MRLLSLLILFLSILVSHAQRPKDYSFFNGTDSFKIVLTEQEKLYADRKVKLKLINHESHKKKILREKTNGDLKIIGNDTTYLVFVIDFYPEYFIGFFQPFYKTKDSIFYTEPTRYKRLKYQSIEWFETHGHRRTGYQLITGFTTMTAGIELSIFPLFGLAPLSFIPIGIPATYFGIRMLSGISTRKYEFDNWAIELKK